MTGLAKLNNAPPEQVIIGEQIYKVVYDTSGKPPWNVKVDGENGVIRVGDPDGDLNHMAWKVLWEITKLQAPSIPDNIPAEHRDAIVVNQTINVIARALFGDPNDGNPQTQFFVIGEDI